MGGIYFDAIGLPYMWRLPFPEDVQDRVVSASNPDGTITNSDLEHTALLAQVSLITAFHPVAYATIASGCDNTPAISRVGKGAVTSTGPGSHQCIYACDHQRQHRYHHDAQFLPGHLNVMADDASRLQHLSDSAFLSHFYQRYPQ